MHAYNYCPLCPVCVEEDETLLHESAAPQWWCAISL